MDYFVLKTSRIFSIIFKVGGKQQKRTHLSAPDWRARNVGVQLQLSDYRKLWLDSCN